jgi:hypothetical protein
MNMFFLGGDIISELIPKPVWEFVIPGLVGGFVIALVIYQFMKYIFGYDLLEELS